MKNILLFLLASTCFAAVGNKHLILISVDGMRPIEYQRANSYAPTITAFAQAGCWATSSKPVFPSVTYPNHTAMVTGQLPAAHGIVSNTVFDPQNLTNGGWFWYADQIRTPTLWDVVKQNGGTTAAISWPVTVGANIDFLIPEYRTVRHPDDVELLRALSTKGLMPSLEKQLGSNVGEDEWKAKAAGLIFEVHKPSLTLLHLAALDHEQHVKGLDVPESIQALKTIDSLIAQLKRQVEAAAGGDPVIWMIVSDHGFQKTEKEFNPAVVLSSLGLASFGKNGAAENWRVYPWGAGGAFALVAKDPHDREAIAQARERFEALAKDPQTGIRKLYSPEELKTLGAFPSAFLAADMKEGFTVGSKRSGEIVDATDTRGMHGYDPDNPNMQASFVLAGSNIPHCEKKEGVKQTDIAPTAAALLGISFPASTGKNITP